MQALMEAAQQRATADQRRLHGAKQTASLELARAQNNLHTTTLELSRVQVPLTPWQHARPLQAGVLCSAWQWALQCRQTHQRWGQATLVAQPCWVQACHAAASCRARMAAGRLENAPQAPCRGHPARQDSPLAQEEIPLLKASEAMVKRELDALQQAQAQRKATMQEVHAGNEELLLTILEQQSSVRLQRPWGVHAGGVCRLQAVCMEVRT